MKKLLLCAAAAVAALTASADVIWEGNVVTGSWGNVPGTSAVQVGAAAFATASEGDKVVVTVSDVAAGTEYPKYILKNANGWDDLVGGTVDTPTPGDYSTELEEENLNILKNNGLIIQGDGLTITKVTLQTSATFTYSTLWEGNCDLTWDFDAATYPSIDGAALDDLKAGDIISFTVTKIGEKSNWPKVVVRDKKDEVIKELELWDFIGEALPTVKSIVVEDPAAFKDGFYCVGCAASISKIELGVKEGGAPVDPNTLVLWEGEPTAMNWSTCPEVSATKGGKVQVGDLLELTVTDFGTAQWTSVVLQDLVDYNDIYKFELWTPRDESAALPYVATVQVTADMAAGMAKGFRMGGDANGAVITKLVAKHGETAIEAVDAEMENAPVEYFNLQGVRVANPENGLYIMRQGNKVTKVLVK